jgi:hypothetical protein
VTIEPALTSAITALVAVIVSPIVSIYVAKRQIRAAVVSANRQKWVDQLRNRIAELIAALRFLNLRRDGSVTLTQDEWIERFQHVLQLSSMVVVLLNPQEEDHKALHAALQEAGSLLLSTSDDPQPQDRRRHPAHPRTVPGHPQA